MTTTPFVSRPVRPTTRRRGSITAHVVRPRGPRGPQDGRWYWRARRGRTNLWSGWASDEEIVARLAELAVAIEDDPMLSTRSTVGQVLDAWLKYFLTLRRRPASHQIAQCSVDRLRHSLKAIRSGKLTTSAVQRWASGALDRYSHSTVEADLRRLRCVWRWARDPERCPQLPQIGTVDLGLPPRRHRHTPSDPEVMAVHTHLRARAPRWVVRAFELQAVLGTRIGETTALRWSDVNLVVGDALVSGKTGARVVPLPPAMLVRLRAWRDEAPAGLVIGADAPDSAVSGMAGWLRKACDDVGCRRWTMHALRRRAVDRLARAGVDVGTAAALMGHSVQVMLDAYRQVTDDDRRRAAQAAALGDVLGRSADASSVQLRLEGYGATN